MASPSRIDLAAALKDSAVAAAIALGLFGLLVGLRTEASSTSELELLPRPLLLAIVVAVVFAGRFLIVLLYQSGAFGLDLGRFVSSQTTTRIARLSRFGGPILLLFALAMPFLFDSNRYYLDLGILVLTYVMLGWGLNIVVGLAGLLDLGYVAFYAVGAYSYALMAQYSGLSFWVCLPVAGILACLFGVLLGFPVLRQIGRAHV